LVHHHLGHREVSGMGYPELSRTEIVEVVRRWQMDASQRAMARASGVVRETVPRSRPVWGWQRRCGVTPSSLADLETIGVRPASSAVPPSTEASRVVGMNDGPPLQVKVCASCAIQGSGSTGLPMLELHVSHVRMPVHDALPGVVAALPLDAVSDY
jgi:hypothetical protein